MRRLADRIADLGHEEAAVILDDLARRWETGVWEGVLPLTSRDRVRV
jgi:hypothetical protein